MTKNVLTYLPHTAAQAEPITQALTLAVVSELHNAQPASVSINEQHYPVAGYLSLLPGLVPGIKLGDSVLISNHPQGVLIHGVVTPIDTPQRASFRFEGDTLVIEAQGAVHLKSGQASVELNAAGEVRIAGKNVRTVAKKILTFLGSKINLN
jgi:hypothetical protein